MPQYSVRKMKCPVNISSTHVCVCVCVCVCTFEYVSLSLIHIMQYIHWFLHLCLQDTRLRCDTGCPARHLLHKED